MKIILVLLDGLGDRSYAQLGNKTPLESASTPNLDRLASWGSNGLFHASVCGQCLPSEMAHYLLFGYSEAAFPGRGLLEAVGEGVAFDEDDVIALAHLSHMEWQEGRPLLVDKRPPMPEADLAELLSAVRAATYDGCDFLLQPTRGHDALLRIKGAVSAHVSDSDPMTAGRPMARIYPLDDNPEPRRAERTAKALNAYLTHCHTILEDHSINRRRRANGLAVANFLATQRCGKRITQVPFQEKWGLKGLLIASGAVYGGLARELGMAFERVEDTPSPGEDLARRLRLALDDGKHDFIHVHTKVPDEAAHTGDPEKKKRAIRLLDSGLGPLMDPVGTGREDLLGAVTADHSTASISRLIHSGEPVPLLLVGKNVRRDDVSFYDEVSAAKGCLGLLRGRELMLMLLNYADRSALLGHHLGGRKRPYVPAEYPPFEPVEG